MVWQRAVKNRPHSYCFFQINIEKSLKNWAVDEKSTLLADFGYFNPILEGGGGIMARMTVEGLTVSAG